MDILEGTDVIDYGWGLFMGLLFGVLIQRAHVARFHVILGQLLLRDWTVAKVMTTAAAVGAVGAWGLADADLAAIQPRMAAVGNLIIGGVLFGVGLAVFGYCPGTALVASMEGRRDAAIGVMGMFCGALIYTFTGGWLTGAVSVLGTIGAQTLPAITNIGPVPWIAALFLLVLAIGILDWRRGPAVAAAGEEPEGAAPIGI